MPKPMAMICATRIRNRVSSVQKITVRIRTICSAATLPISIASRSTRSTASRSLEAEASMLPMLIAATSR